MLPLVDDDGDDNDKRDDDDADYEGGEGYDTDDYDDDDADDDNDAGAVAEDAVPSLTVAITRGGRGERRRRDREHAGSAWRRGGAPLHHGRRLPPADLGK